MQRLLCLRAWPQPENSAVVQLFQWSRWQNWKVVYSELSQLGVRACRGGSGSLSPPARSQSCALGSSAGFLMMWAVKTQQYFILELYLHICSLQVWHDSLYETIYSAQIDILECQDYMQPTSFYPSPVARYELCPLLLYLLPILQLFLVSPFRWQTKVLWAW